MDETSLNQEKIESQKRTKEARLQAKADYASALDELQKKKTLGLENIEKNRLVALENVQDEREIKNINQAAKREKKAFLKRIAAEKKKLKVKESFEKRFRHYVSSIDAFFARPKMWIVNLVTIAIFVGAFIFFGIHSGSFEANKSNPDMMNKFFMGFLVPDYNLFLGTGSWSFDQSVVYLCLQTFAIAFVGTLFASLLAIPFGFLASHKLMGKYAIISEIFLILIRTFPEIVFCMVLVQITGIGPITGVLVLSIQSVGMLGKMYSDDLDSMNMTFLESLDSSGGTTMSKIRVGVLPQVSSNFISTVLYRFDLNLRNASILGIVGAGDMGRLILNYSNNQNWPQLGALLWGLLVMVLLVDLVSTKIRKKLV